MSGLSLLVSLLSIGISLYALSGYFTRRHAHDAGVGALRTGPALRQLSAEEQAALTPYLTVQRLTTDGGVRALSGVFVVHALTVTGGYQRAHQTIDGVDVLLPYDAQDFIASYNQAEVVLTNKVAVVVSLNGFTLLEGRARSMGELTPDAANDPGTFEVETLGRRMETANEVDRRMAMLNRGGRSALCWSAAFWLLWAASRQDVGSWSAALIAGSVVFCVLALVMLRPSRQTPEPQTVDRLRGRLTQLQMAQSGNVSVHRMQFFLGSTVPISLPWHWQHSGRVHVGELVDLEVRASDRQLLTLRPGLSLGEESRLFPEVHWGRALVIFLLAMTALLFVWLGSPSLGNDIAVAWQRWSVGGETPYATASDVVKAQPPVGKSVDIIGKGRCELRLTDGADDYKAPYPDCNLVRWGGEPLTVAPVDLSGVAAAAMHFGGAYYLRFRPYIYTADPKTLDVMARRLAIRGDMSTFATNAMELHELKVTFDVIESVCRTPTSSCAFLKQQFLDFLDGRSVVMGRGRASRAKPVADWASLATSGYFDPDVYVVISEDDFVAFNQTSRQVGQPAFISHMNGLAQAALAGQRGGVVLRLARSPERQRSEKENPMLISLEAGETPSQILGQNGFHYWQDLPEWFKAHGEIPFQIRGNIIAIERMPDGAPLLTIDRANSVNDIWTATARVLWFALAVILALVYGTIFLIRWRQAARRWKALEQHVRAQAVFQGLI